MNYNVKGVPVFWYWHFRHKYIGKYLLEMKNAGEGADIIAFQEMMHRKTSRIHKITKYPYRDRGPKKKGIKISSGLEILSNYSFVDKNEMIFKDCSGTDCFSRKGVQHVRVNIEKFPFPIDIYNTHLNAGIGRHIFSRHAQIAQMNEFIGKTRDPKIPMIVLGDFNFKQSDEAYDIFTSAFMPQNAAENCGIRKTCAGDKDPYDLWRNGLIDHQFYCPGNSGKITMTPVFYKHYFTKTKVGRFKKFRLSDHPGVVVDYKIQFFK